MATNGIEVTGVRTPWTLENKAPEYLRQKGEHHWVLKLECGIEVAAIHEGCRVWTVFPVSGEHYNVSGLDDNHIIMHLKHEVKAAVMQAMKDVESW